MHLEPNAPFEVPDFVRDMKASVLAVLVFGLTGATLLHATKSAAELVSRTQPQPVTKAANARVTPQVATQKLLRNPWQRSMPKAELITLRSEPHGSEPLPYHYW